VRRQLELKFGVLGASVLSSLESADELTIERYAERIITAASLAEVLND